MKVVLVDCLIYQGLLCRQRRHAAPSPDRDEPTTIRMKKAQCNQRRWCPASRPGGAVTVARRWAISLRVRGICPAAAGPRPDSMAAAMVRTAAPRLHPAEPGTGPGHQLIECPQPAARVYAGASGRQKIIASRHKPR